ncbi:MAG: HK97 gp10 family phage protein [Vicinamibacterales bacterium]
MAAEGFEGMADLISGLGRLGDVVQTEAASIVRSTAELMRARVRARYRRRSGVLQDRVVVEAGTRGGRSSTGGSSLRWKVRSRAPHAHLYEEGTAERFTAATGASRGRMPATPTFVPEAVLARERMHQQLISMVGRQTVAGMTGRLEVRAS